MPGQFRIDSITRSPGHACIEIKMASEHGSQYYSLVTGEDERGVFSFELDALNGVTKRVLTDEVLTPDLFAVEDSDSIIEIASLPVLASAVFSFNC